MMKRGQAAMEFLMTYGWALLVVLVAIGALAFFGVLNPGQFLPDQCTAFAGLTCTSYFASSDGTAGQSEVTLAFQNGLGYTMTNFDVNLNFNPAAGSIPTQAAGNCDGSAPLVDGARITCTFTYPDVGGSNAFSTSDRLKGTANISWVDSSLGVPNSHTRNANLALTVEP